MVKQKSELLAHRPGELSLKALEGNRDQQGIKYLNRRRVQKGGKVLYAGYDITGMVKRDRVSSQEWNKSQKDAQ